MSNNLLMCYEKKACYFCKKAECDKRVQVSGYNSKFVKMCDGNCYECSDAVRSSFSCNLYELEDRFRGCLMYHYINEIQSFEFYGRVGTKSDYSKIELAILQLRKCQNCEEKRKYLKILSEISSKIKEIPKCFESTTDLTSTRALSIANSSISDVLEHNFECKTKIVLKRVINEYLASNEDDTIDVNKLCEYINFNQSSIDYFIHPLTVNAILSEI